MDNKKLGFILIVVCILLGVVFFSLKAQLDAGDEAACACGTGTCPMEERSPIAIYGVIILLSILIALGIYLIFFEKGQKEIISTLEKQKQVQTEEEKYNILLKGLSKEERKVLNAVKEQDGITQQTLRIRTDTHKSKLSIILSELEKKGLIKRISKGKTNKVFLKMKL